MTPAEKLAKIHELLLEKYGKPEIGDKDPLSILIKTILSQNTSDLNRDRAYDALIAKFGGNFEKIMEADVSEIEEAIKVGGLAKQKAATIKRTLEWVKENFGKFDLTELCGDPEAEKKLTSIKGVGIKTARVTLLFGCQHDSFPIDTHIYRVLKRTGVIPPNASREKAHTIVDELITPKIADVLHLNIIRLGREICHARKPKCEICPIAAICEHRKAQN